MNCWFTIFYITALSRWTLSHPSAEFTTGSCTFSSYSRVLGYILRGNVLSEYNVPHGIKCRKICDKAANCQSVNLLKRNETSFVCQLNQVSKENSPSAQFVKSEGGEYFGMKKRSLCKTKTQGCASETPWHAFNQSYFKLVETTMDWQSAREYCLKENGDLASISSKEEHQFLYETFMKGKGEIHVYVGLNDIKSEGDHVWSDGSPSVYLKYAAGQPNGATSENCFTIITYSGQAGLLNDIACSYSAMFLCKVD